MPPTTPGRPRGSAAGRAPFGTWAGGIAVSPSFAVSPGRTGVRRTNPRSGLPCSAAVEPWPCCRTPLAPNVSWITRSDALIAPFSGSRVYMMCQITPAAKSEIAIGMKTAVLKATAQLTRSVRTAKISPMAVTSAGTTPTQIALFSIARTSVSVVKSVR